MAANFERLKGASREVVAATNPEALLYLETIERSMTALFCLTKDQSPERAAGAGFAMGLALYSVQKISQEYTESCFKNLGAGLPNETSEVGP